MSRMQALVLLLLGMLAIPLLAAADYLEVRRTANIYEDSDRHSPVVVRYDVSTHEVPYVHLLQNRQENGYYKVRLPGEAEEGWIYRSYVRRFPGQVPAPPYDRIVQYGRWIDADKDCQDTRAEVLIRDQVGPGLEFKDTKNCLVSKGTWHDPYTGTTFHNASELQIDHVVPLKNAHVNGAWAWPKERKREYANYLEFDKHLLAVQSSENSKKGDKGPDKYLPPRTAYHCEYVGLWTQMKTDWHLEIPPNEQEAMNQVRVNCS